MSASRIRSASLTLHTISRSLNARKRNSFLAAVLLVVASAMGANTVQAANPTWDTFSVGSGGFTTAMLDDWRDNQPDFSANDAVQQAAYDWCKTTTHYVNTALDCTAHAGFEDTVVWYDGGPVTSEYFYFSVNMYRNNGQHGNVAVRWYPYYTSEANCPTGDVIGPDNYNCIVPDHYVETGPQSCPGPKNNKSNPCDPANGNKHQVEVDYVIPGEGGLSFARYYNSTGPYRTGETMGAGWRHTYSRAINERPDRDPSVTFAAPASQSSSYATASAACTSGWNDIKADVWGGDLSTATATFSGGNVCKIESGGSTVAQIPVRARYQWSGFSAPSTIKTITRPNGTAIVFELDGSDWVSDLNPALSLVQSGSDWIFTDANDTEETFDTDGRLTSIEYRNGQTETLTYDATTGFLTKVTGPFGHKIEFQYSNNRLYKTKISGLEIKYTYDSEGNLKDAKYPYGKYRKYIYEDTDRPNHLTGITDENNDRYATWAYDDAGRAISSEHGTGQEEVLFAYNTDGSTTLTMGNGAVRNYFYSVEQGNRKLEELTGDVCSTCPGGNIAARSYDSNGYLDEATDWNGNITKTARNSEGLVTTLTEAKSSTEQRVTTTTWHSTYRLPTQISTPKNDTNFTYDTDGNPLTVTVTDGTDSRTWTMTYNTNGQVLTVNGPRTDVSDVTTFEYNVCTYGSKCGQLKKITNALSQVTTFNYYDSFGRVTKYTDPNGLITQYTYDPRGNLLTVKQTPTVGTLRTTTMTYDNASQLKTVTLPNGQVLTYAYNSAHYLTSVTDNLDNSIDYAYDSMGNRSDEDTYDPTDTLTRALDYVYDLNDRLAAVTEPGSYDTDFTFDDVGNLTNVTDAALAQTNHGYDDLNRLEQTQDALLGYTDYLYDAHDNVTSVAAANGATTTYEYDDLDNLTKEISPDRGTITYAHDDAGNIATMTDARGKVTSYTYDAINRLTEIELDNLDTITFQYDTGTNAIGRLNKITDPSGETTWTYNNFGEVTAKTQKIGTISLTTSYAYDTSGRMTTMTLPSGKVVTYGYNTFLATSMTVDSTTILSSATYEPFGPVSGWTWGNSTSHSRSFNTRGLLASQSMVTDTRTLGYDNVGGLITLDDSRHDLGFDYNVLGQITDFTAAGSSALTAQDYSYDENGNRETLVQNSATYNYTITTNTNRLASTTGPTAKTYTYDAAGNATGDGIHTYVYDDRGRLTSIDSGSVTYEHNGQGQRVKKDDGTDETLFVYDEAGQLIGEYDDTGTAILEHVWFSGAPVAALDGANKYYVHTDHLGTPRVVSNGNTTIWRWETGPFGEEVAQEDPDGDSTDFTYNLRFAGQYYDVESALHYNYFRTYDPSTGRYLESDPIGLAAGLNTYGYVDGNPMSWVDPLGLAKCVYSISNHTIVCTTDDGRSEQVGPEGVHSGLDACQDNPDCADEKNKGPTQPGEYEMIPSNKYGGSYWLREGFFDRQLCKLGIGRCEFFFHQGTYSLGCITVEKTNSDAIEQFNRVKDMLRGESDNTMKVVP